MSNQFKDSLIEAMETLRSDNTKITYECKVIKCLDGVAGEYELEYHSSIIRAYALNVSKKYSPNELVLVIAPKGDFNDVKYILGLATAKPSEGGGTPPEPEPENKENTFIRLTDDLLDKDNPEIDIFGLKSYYSEDYDKQIKYYEENITSRVCDAPKFKERIIKYVDGKEITYLRLKITIKTNLSQEQIYSSGNYGIKLLIPFVNKGYVQYDFNSNSMEGSPKSFLDWTLQTYDIKIDQGLAYNDAMPPVVKIYKKDFILNESKVAEPDIEIRSVELYAMSMLTPEEMKGYRVFISATGGSYFLKSDSINDKKILTASLKSNGIDTDISEDEMYWFLEDPTIDEKDPEYFAISGKGWKCLNPYTIEKGQTETGETVDKIIFDPRLEQAEVIAKDISGARKFKCLIKHKGNYFSGEITITNETETFFLGLIPTKGEVVSLYDDEVELKLKFHYKGLTETLDNVEKLCYTWSKIEKDGKEDFYFTKKYLRVIEKNKLIVDGDKSYWVTTVIFPSSIINGEATIKCALELDGAIPDLEEFKEEKKHYLGTAEVKLKLTEEIVDPALEDMRKAIPKSLYSYNTSTLKVQQNGVVIASIACKLLRKTDLQGHLVVNLISSEYCNAVVRFLDNEMTELFAPVTFTLQPGRNTIGVPHDYLYRLTGIHSFIVTMQCTNGILTIPVRGVSFTISGGYMLERLMDIGMDIQDLSVKQSKGIEFDEEWIPYEPEELWTIGLDNGEILVKSCKYILDDVLEWTPRYKMGKGLTAAIEFDGKWVLREQDENYTLITEKEPFIFVVELDGTLVVYKGGDLTTRRVLDTNVTQLSVVRGFKSELYKEQDQGLICAYIKEGFPYYIRYVYMEVIKEYNWTNPVALFNEKVLGIYVQRLNDYRIGFLLEFKDRNMWYISTRTYVAQAVPKEQLDFYAYDQMQCCSCILNTELDTLVGEEVPFKDNTQATDTFQIKFKWPLIYRSKKNKGLDISKFTMKADGKNVIIRDVQIKDNMMTIYTKEKLDHQPYEDSHIEITFKDYLLQLFYHNEHYHQIEDKTYKYTIVRPYNTLVYDDLFTENLSISLANESKKIEIVPILVLKPKIEELLEMSIKKDNPTISVIPVNIIPQEVKENLDMQLKNNIPTIDVILIGTEPI